MLKRAGWHYLGLLFLMALIWMGSQGPVGIAIAVILALIFVIAAIVGWQQERTENEQEK